MLRINVRNKLSHVSEFYNKLSMVTVAFAIIIVNNRR